MSEPTRQSSDAGFTLIEMLVALSLIGTVASFAVGFHVSSLSAIRSQAHRQVAAQLVSDALDAARADGPAAAMNPRAPLRVSVDGVSYTQTWDPPTVCTSSVCGSIPSGAELVKVQVTVAWTEETKSLSERGSALVSTAAVDPTFPS
jgi:prepilin-type N-terminal cleavage/methylation domain-containing protein